MSNASPRLRAATGMRRQVKKGSLFGGALHGSTLYEFRMQVRRPALWITFALVTVVFFFRAWTPWDPALEGNPASFLVPSWSLSIQFLHPIAFGLLLADRLPRDSRTGASELLETLPASSVRRYLGKYLGATLATLVPLVITWSAGVTYIAVDTGDPVALPLGIAAFLTINLPGLLFVAAFSVSCPVVLWIPLYQFFFIGYWFWGNLLPEFTGIPSLTGTHLTPIGEYPANGFFTMYGTSYGTEPTALDGVVSMGLLLSLAALALVCGYRLWRRQTYV